MTTEPNDGSARAAGHWLEGAELYQAWRSARRAGQGGARTPFTIPGHKGRAHELAAELGDLFAADLPMYGGLDEVGRATATVARAELKGADLWGADWCRFSTDGSTHANQALALSVGRPGDTVLVARTAHRSTLTGLVLAGLDPVWLSTDVDLELGVPTGLSVGSVRRALDEHPEAVALFLVEPGYLGTLSDLPALVALAHDRGRPVVVDQAWGAHLGFHPAYPPHALAAGADAMVTSAHKTLPAWTQASLAVARTDRLDRDRLEQGFEAGLTTSPSGATLASIDVARALLAGAAGVGLLGRLVELAARLRADLAVAGLRTLDPADLASGRFDPAKVVVLAALSGLDGRVLERHLLDDGIPVEMADRDIVVPIVTLVDSAETVARLRDSLLEAVRQHPPSAPRRAVVAPQWLTAPPKMMPPREAFFADRETVTAAAAVGRVSAELVAPYPPGIPVLVPGELVEAETMARLVEAADLGVRVAYAADPSLRTLQVVRD